MANEDVIKEMPIYEAHKPVRAARLIDFEEQRPGDWMLVIQFPDKSLRELVVDSDWINFHNPTDQGYVVVGTDGALAYSSAYDFEPTFVADAKLVAKQDVGIVISRAHLFKEVRGEKVALEGAEKQAAIDLVAVEVEGVLTPELEP